jgi:hypothetical protein
VAIGTNFTVMTASTVVLLGYPTVDRWFGFMAEQYFVCFWIKNRTSGRTGDIAA